ncbi:Xpo1-domain-containing protein [Tothia fuscella]|uniref:Exportin-T n=1 Tax=Tothia fuscella TaxID=1048955 RepID=A0A9P4TSF7_9PEZI|nr:Xpo1-domain-containing protein [Tothia fuscella]
MDPAQVENAISIAWDHTSSSDLKAQALNFIQQLRSDINTWQILLPLFTKSPSPPDATRHFCLEVVNLAIQSPQLDLASRTYIKDNLWNYVQQYYGGNGENVTDSTHIQNKLTQTLTYLFTTLYASGWESFFDDFLSLAGGAGALGVNNIPATALYLRILGSLHDEIADVIIPRSPEEAKRNTELKDLVRARDAQKVSVSWQEILAKWRQIDLSVVEMCLKAISRWVSWIDISLVVNQTVLAALLEMAGQQGLQEHSSVEVKVRDAAIDTFTETAGKKMRPPEKMELLLFLNLKTVVGQLIASPPLEELRKTPHYDTDLAETVAKLVNNVVRDIVIVLDTPTVDEQTRQRANELLQAFIPYLLRFFSDEYDEVCSTVLDSLTELLNFFRKVVKTGPLPALYAPMLSPILDAIISKMRFDETANWGESDEETDEAEFLELRKRLNILQQYVAAIDELLYMDTLTTLVVNTLSKLGIANVGSLDWRELDLALYEMYLFGDLASRNRGLYQKSAPSSVASERLIQMMRGLMESTVESYPHPAIQLQYMELCVRYGQFFEQNEHLIPKGLEIFVSFAHSHNEKVRLKSWYLFLRFVKLIRGHLGQVSQTIIQAISDLLPIKASLSSSREDGSDDDSAPGGDETRDVTFESQLYLFEAVGCISSTSSIPLQTKILYVRSVMSPIFADMQFHISDAKGGNERALLQMHHDIKALGTLARGYTDWMPGVKTTAPPPSEVSSEFLRAAEAILAALESLRSSSIIRDASRYSFARLVGGCGTGIFPQLPRWIDGMLSQSSSKEEMSFFLRLLEQVVFAFKAEMFNVLDVVLTPLLRKVFERMGEEPTGTDDEIQLQDLQREYLNFILAILNNDLAAVFVSENNQAIFDSLISTIEHFARSPKDIPTSRLSFAVLTKMVLTWGGPDVPLPPQNSANGPTSPTSPTTSAFPPTNPSPQPVFPGFDTFAIKRFSPLSWAIPSNVGFRVKDPASRSMIHDIAFMQEAILKKTGQTYLDELGGELTGMGVNTMEVQKYLGLLMRGAAGGGGGSGSGGQPGSAGKAFREFLVGFLGREG